MRVMWTVLLAVFLAVPVAQADGPVGFVAAVRGEANVIRGGESETALVGAEVREGDELQTGAKSRLKVLFTDDVILALGSDTQVVVKKHLFDPKSSARSTRLDLLKGKLRSLVQKLVAGSQADFEVQTGNAVAGVRGTEFVLVASEGETNLYTYSGEVDLAGDNGERVVVAAGEGSDVGGEGEAKKPEVVAVAVLKRLRGATDTQQSPEAVAWNLKVGAGDRLVVGAEGVEVAEEGELDQEVMPSEGSGPQERHPKIEPCADCRGNLPAGEATVSNGFGAGDVRDDGVGGQEGPLDGDWINLENDHNFDPGVASPVTLKIVIHREHRR